MLITCPRCPARWTGLKLEHCPAAGCHLTFSSTRAGDRHLVDMDDRGWSRHLTQTRCEHFAPTAAGTRGTRATSTPTAPWCGFDTAPGPIQRWRRVILTASWVGAPWLGPEPEP